MFQPTGSVNITAASILQGNQPADDGIVFANQSNMYYYTASNNQPQCLANMPGHTSTIIAILTYRNSPSDPYSILSVSRSGELILWTVAPSSRLTTMIQYIPSLVDVSRLTNKPITCIDARDSNTILLGCTSCIVICRRVGINTHFSPTYIDISCDINGYPKRSADGTDSNRLMTSIITAVYLKSIQQSRDNSTPTQLATASAGDSVIYGFYVALINVVYYVEVCLKTSLDAPSMQNKDYRSQDPQQQNVQQGPIPLSNHIVWRNENQPVIDSIYSLTIGNTDYIFFGRRNGNLTILSLNKTRQQYITLYDGPLTPSSISDFGSNHTVQSKSGIRFMQLFAKFDVLCIILADSTVIFINIKKLNECGDKITNLSLLIQSVVKHIGKYITASFEQLHSDVDGPVLRLFTIMSPPDTSVSLC